MSVLVLICIWEPSYIFLTQNSKKKVSHLSDPTQFIASKRCKCQGKYDHHRSIGEGIQTHVGDITMQKNSKGELASLSHLQYLIDYIIYMQFLF